MNSNVIELCALCSLLLFLSAGIGICRIATGSVVGTSICPGVGLPLLSFTARFQRSVGGRILQRGEEQGETKNKENISLHSDSSNNTIQHSNIHIKPEAGMATWFRYVGDMTTLEDGTVTGASDSGYSEHSGCPVIEGEKKIVTQWMRAGVNAEEPWDR